MKRVTQNPLPAIESMLDSCRRVEVSFFFTRDAAGKSICVYPISDDTFAARHALQIVHGNDPMIQAAVIGLVHLHNVRYADQTSAAAAAFIRICTADFHFGHGFGDGL